MEKYQELGCKAPVSEKTSICKTFANNGEIMLEATSLALSIKRTLVGDETTGQCNGEQPRTDSLEEEAQYQWNNLGKLMNVLRDIREAL